MSCFETKKIMSKCHFHFGFGDQNQNTRYTLFKRFNMLFTKLNSDKFSQSVNYDFNGIPGSISALYLPDTYTSTLRLSCTIAQPCFTWFSKN